jgi:hypothetical protein
LRLARGLGLPREQPPELGIGAQRVEVGVDGEPSGREHARDLQQRFELYERLLGLADEHVDPNELMLVVGTIERILRHGQELDAPTTLPDRLLLPTQITERQTETEVPPDIVGRCSKLLLEGLPRLFRMNAHAGRVSPEGVGLSQA